MSKERIIPFRDEAPRVPHKPSWMEQYGGLYDATKLVLDELDGSDTNTPWAFQTQESHIPQSEDTLEAYVLTIRRLVPGKNPTIEDLYQQVREIGARPSGIKDRVPVLSIKTPPHPTTYFETKVFFTPQEPPRILYRDPTTQEVCEALYGPETFSLLDYGYETETTDLPPEGVIKTASDNPVRVKFTPPAKPYLPPEEVRNNPQVVTRTEQPARSIIPRRVNGPVKSELPSVGEVDEEFSEGAENAYNEYLRTRPPQIHTSLTDDRIAKGLERYYRKVGISPVPGNFQEDIAETDRDPFIDKLSRAVADEEQQ